MTNPDEIESGAVLETAQNQGAHFTGGATNVSGLPRLRHELEAARSTLATLGPLGAALWALYPLAIVLLVVGILVAQAGSV